MELSNENIPSITKDLSYEEIASLYRNLIQMNQSANKKLDKRNQAIHSATKKSKINEMIVNEVKEDIELLKLNSQKEKSESEQVFEKTLNSIQLEIDYQRDNHLLEIKQKTKTINILQQELLSAKRSGKAEETRHKFILEYDILKEEIEKLQKDISLLNEEFFSFEKTESNKQLDHEKEMQKLKESLVFKKQELSDCKSQLNELEGEQAILKNELSMAKMQQSDAASNKVKSLFSEVDDQRLELLEAIQKIKTDHNEIKTKYENMFLHRSHLLKEKEKIVDKRKRDLEEIFNDNDSLLQKFKKFEKDLIELDKVSDANSLKKEDINYYSLMQHLEDKRKELESLQLKLKSKILIDFQLHQKFKVLRGKEEFLNEFLTNEL